MDPYPDFIFIEYTRFVYDVKQKRRLIVFHDLNNSDNEIGLNLNESLFDIFFHLTDSFSYAKTIAFESISFALKILENGDEYISRIELIQSDESLSSKLIIQNPGTRQSYSYEISFIMGILLNHKHKIPLSISRHFFNNNSETKESFDSIDKFYRVMLGQFIRGFIQENNLDPSNHKAVERILGQYTPSMISEFVFDEYIINGLIENNGTIQQNTENINQLYFDENNYLNIFYDFIDNLNF